ncbi:MAG: hypothetical protein U1E52_19680 [Geminicoccaceae bacterium]
MAATANNPPPVKDHAWGGGCTLSSSVQNTIKNALQAESSALGTVSVDFIVIHTVTAQNDGQPLKSGGNTGVVLCTFPGTNAKVTTETTPIPNATDQPGSTNIDVLQVQQQAVQQYKINDGARANKTEKRVCQTTQGNTDCWRVSKP